MKKKVLEKHLRERGSFQKVKRRKRGRGGKKNVGTIRE